MDVVKVSEYKPYVQSSNCLFHFMNERRFLEGVLKKGGLPPRYCKEDISYISKNNNDLPDEIAVLQKCFCDIPLHKIYDHTKFYGSYAIAFSKEWCEKQNILPLQYISEHSPYAGWLNNYISTALRMDKLDNLFADEIMQRLALIKPIRGKQKRKKEDGSEEEKDRNFHDEKEWRYIPSIEVLEKSNNKNRFKFEVLIADQELLSNKYNVGGSRFIDIQSSEIEESNYRDLWLKFDYEDVRYLIVGNKQDRIDLINFIMDELTVSEGDIDMLLQKYVLISKILVLDEIVRDS